VQELSDLKKLKSKNSVKSQMKNSHYVQRSGGIETFLYAGVTAIVVMMIFIFPYQKQLLKSRKNINIETVD